MACWWLCRAQNDVKRPWRGMASFVNSWYDLHCTSTSALLSAIVAAITICPGLMSSPLWWPAGLNRIAHGPMRHQAFGSHIRNSSRFDRLTKYIHPYHPPFHSEDCRTVQFSRLLKHHSGNWSVSFQRLFSTPHTIFAVRETLL